MTATPLRWRKFSPIDREYPIYELMAGEVVLLDLALRDDGGIEVGFHGGATGRVLDLAVLEDMIRQGKQLLQEDLASAPADPP
jgi:hypothetical protein